MFCVECGKEGPTTDGLCAECFAERHPVVEVSAHVDVARCASCGSFRIGSTWRPMDLSEAVPAILEETIRVLDPFTDVTFDHTIRAEDDNNFALRVVARGRYGGLEPTQSFRTRLRLKPVLCETCTKQRSQYYAGIVQVRGTGRDLTPAEVRGVRTFVLARADRAREGGDFVSKMEATHGGLDFYVSTNAFGKTLAHDLADSFGGDVSSSPKLFGRRGGKDVYRVTSLVRFAPFRVGDVVRYKGRTHEVLRVANLVTLRDLVSGDARPFRPRDLKAARRLDAERVLAKIVRLESGDVLAEHPDTGATRPVGTRGAAPGRATVLWTDGEAYVSALPSTSSKS